MTREDLARRAVAAWQKCGLDWMSGMACRNGDGFGFIVLNVDTKGRLLLWNPPWSSETRLFPSGSVLPDMEAHATLGCIEHGMLPAAWPEHEIEVHRHPLGHEVFVRTDEGDIVWSSGWTPGGDVGATMVVCLEAAAERREP